jgi:hypothetical protein
MQGLVTLVACAATVALGNGAQAADNSPSCDPKSSATEVLERALTDESLAQCFGKRAAALAQNKDCVSGTLCYSNRSTYEYLDRMTHKLHAASRDCDQAKVKLVCDQRNQMQDAMKRSARDIDTGRIRIF